MIFEKGNLKDLKEIVNVNYKIFKGMYSKDTYSLEDYQKRLTDFVIFCDGK